MVDNILGTRVAEPDSLNPDPNPGSLFLMTKNSKIQKFYRLKKLKNKIQKLDQ